MSYVELPGPHSRSTYRPPWLSARCPQVENTSAPVRPARAVNSGGGFTISQPQSDRLLRTALVECVTRVHGHTHGHPVSRNLSPTFLEGAAWAIAATATAIRMASMTRFERTARSS